MPLDFGDAYSPDKTHTRASSVGCRNRRCSHVEAAGSGSEVKSGGIEVERVYPPEPAGDARLQIITQSRPDVHEGDAWNTKQILEVPGNNEVQVALFNIQRNRTQPLIGIHEDQGSVLMREIGQGSHVLQGGIVVRNLVNAEYRGVQPQVRLHNIGCVQPVRRLYELDFRPAAVGARQPDLPDGGELVGSGHDLFPAVDGKTTSDGRDGIGDTTKYGHLIA